MIRDGADFTYPPLEYTAANGTTFTGVDYDLAQAIGKKLGVKMAYSNAAFGTLIPSLQSGRLDIVLSFATVTLEREKTVDFIQYSQSGTAIMVKKGNPKGIKSIDDLCGKVVGLQAGAVQVPIADAQNKKCTVAGKPAIQIKQLGKDSDVQLLLRSGRVDVDLLDAPVAAYSAQTNPSEFEVVPNARYDVRPHGIMVLKGNDQLRDAIFAAVQQVMNDGEYQQILAKYNVPDLGLTAPKLNGATS